MNKTILSCAIVITMAAFAETPTVTDVVAKQRFPWNGLVDITCKVSGINGMTNGLEFAVDAVILGSGDARRISKFWVVKKGVNTTDKRVQVNGTYKLLWNAQSEFGAVIHSNMVMRVNVVAGIHSKVQLWANGPYWAKTNVGAEEPHEYGYYFWWGDTVGYKFENEKWVASNGASSNFSFGSSNTPTSGKDIITLKSEGWIIADGGDYILKPEYDAAHVHWGGNWRMPTKQELDRLSRCNWRWTTMNGVSGYLVSGEDDYASNSIFLPSAGFGYGTSLNDRPRAGYYWSSVPYYNYNNLSSAHSRRLAFYSNGHDPDSSCPRLEGLSVRPVQGFTE